MYDFNLFDEALEIYKKEQKQEQEYEQNCCCDDPDIDGDIDTCVNCGVMGCNILYGKRFSDITFRPLYDYDKSKRFSNILDNFSGIQIQIFKDDAFEKTVKIVSDNIDVDNVHNSIRDIIRKFKLNRYSTSKNLFLVYLGLYEPPKINQQTRNSMIEMFEDFLHRLGKNTVNINYILYKILKKHGIYIDCTELSCLKEIKSDECIKKKEIQGIVDDFFN